MLLRTVLANRQTGFRRAWKAVLGGLLAFLLLGAALAAGAHRSHETGHQTEAAHHLCLICALAAGQVEVAWGGFAISILVPLLAVCRRVVSFCFAEGCFHILPPGRAPPVLQPV
jgi:hypothetical protein